MEIKRLLTNLCSNDLEKSKGFYTSLFPFKVDYESDWFIHLISEGRELELGIIDPDNDIVPKNVSGGMSGMYLTFVVDDVDTFYLKAKNLGVDIQQESEDTFYGQRRMLLVSPEGTVCDVSSPIKP